LYFDLVWFLHSDSPFLGKRKMLLAYQGFERGVATFYELPGNSAVAIEIGEDASFPDQRLRLLPRHA
jgi:hypothetical protein